jgi:hypothetical protein
MLVQSNDLPHGVPAMADTGCMCHACARCRVQADRFFRASPYGAPLFRVVRRIQGLRAIGYTPQDLADVFGMGTEYVEWLTHATRGHVTRLTFARVAAGYERLSSRPQTPEADPRWPSPLAWDEPTDRDRGHRLDDPAGRPRFDEPRLAVHGPKCAEKCAHESCGSVGRVWKRDTVDPLTVTRVLGGDLVPTTRAEKEVIVNAWLATGRSWSSLERLTGWKIEAYRKARNRAKVKAGVAA